MTLGLALVLLGVLLVYCGIKGRSLSRALVGRSEPSSSSGLLEGVSG